jgi:hypothetical protein
MALASKATGRSPGSNVSQARGQLLEVGEETTPTQRRRAFLISLGPRNIIGHGFTGTQSGKFGSRTASMLSRKVEPASHSTLLNEG